MANNIEAAKAAAIERFLVTAEPSNMVTALAVSTKPRNNVTGIGIGTKIKNGKNTGRPCVRIYVEKKIDKKSIPASDMLPAKIRMLRRT